MANVTRADAKATRAALVGVSVAVEGGGEAVPARLPEAGQILRVNVIGDLLDPTHQAGDPFRVDARIAAWCDAAALKVSVGTPFRIGSEWAGLAVVDGRARSGIMRIGLGDGDAVSLHPSDEIEEGTRVEARD